MPREAVKAPEAAYNGGHTEAGRDAPGVTIEEQVRAQGDIQNEVELREKNKLTVTVDRMTCLVKVIVA